MATADLKLVYSGGGGFAPTFFSGVLDIVSGVTGDILTITAPGGRKIRLIGLSTPSGTTQSGISILADGVIVVNALSVSAAEGGGAGTFTIGTVANTALPYVEALNTIIIRKNAGNTVTALTYAFCEGA